jgi:pectin methylesterase-like acyl-CoA thioesterase
LVANFTGQSIPVIQTTTALAGPSPSSPAYGTSVNFTATITPASGTNVPTGSVAFTLDGSTTQTVSVNSSGSATANFTTLTAGSHSVVASFLPSGSFSASNSSTTAFSVAQTVPVINWSPSLSLAYGTPMSAIMNATVSGNLAGTFTYTATSTSNSVTTLTSTTYLPLGVYSLNAIFTPSDTTDYSATVKAVIGVTITQSSTTISIGPTTNVVAADGSGNFTTLAAAIAALPTSGGSIYIRPGTYTGQNIIAANNVSLRGLGGDPTKIILTASNSNGTSGGDKNSSTLQVTGSAFYMENITLWNTYQIDNGVTANSQAVALYLSGDNDVIYNSQISGRQDTLYANEGPSRMYFNSDQITGTVDYIFGDAAAVFDNCTLYTVYNGSYTGGNTVTAQDKSATNYLSGYVITNSQFLSEQDQGLQTNLFFGRTWGEYSTVILVNNYVDDVNPAGWEYMGTPSYLSTATYAEYGTTGPGAAGIREQYAIALTASQAQAYAPNNFLSGSDAWTPTAALAAYIAAVVPTPSSVTIPGGNSITLVARIAPSAFGTPTGSASFYDGGTLLSTITLDALGEASLTTSSLTVGTHNVTIVYAGDSNFIGSTSNVATVTVTGTSTATALTVSNASSTYGTAVTGTATVTPTAATGTVTILVDGSAATTCALSAGSCSYSASGLSAGSHTISASYGGNTTYSASTTPAGAAASVGHATLTLTANNASRIYGQPNMLTYTLSGFQYSDTQANSTTGSPNITTTATRTSATGSYTITAAAGMLAVSGNYSLATVNGTLTVNGGATQVIFFPVLPNLPVGGPYQLTARTNAGQTVTYSITTGSSLTSVNGNALTITGAGTITVTANAAAINGFNAAAAVSRTFTSH